MKKIIILLVSIIAFSACKNDSKTEVKQEQLPQATKDKTAKQNDGLITMKGDFIYYDKAAVLQTKSEIYGVVINDLAKELNNQAKTFQEENTDMVLVTVRCKKSKKPENEEGWDYRVEIKEILKVEAIQAKDNDIIKLGS
jgi:hypothetical protein